MTEPTPEHSRARTIARWTLGLLAIVFGVATVASGGRILFGDDAIRTEAGNVVRFVLVFNFSAGFAYVGAGLAIILQRISSILFARILAGGTVLVFVGLGAHIITGGAFETRTVVAMAVRSAFWLGQAAALPHVFRKS